MATSGSTNFSLNAREIVTTALELIRVKGSVADPAAEDMALGVKMLNLMLKGWQLNGPNLFRQTEGTLTLTSDTQSYTLSSAYRISQARFRQNSRDLPMNVLTREEYFEQPYKGSNGTPTMYYFDPQLASGTLYVWPVLLTASGETIQYTYQRRFEDIDALGNDIDIPQEYLETVAYALAARLADPFDKEAKLVRMTAAQLIGQAKAADRESVIRFEPQLR